MKLPPSSLHIRDADANLAVSSINHAPTFSVGDGKVSTDIGGTLNYGYALAVQPDNRSVVVGVSTTNGDSDASLVRYRADGMLDTTFAQGGKLILASPGVEERAESIAILADGRLVVVGASQGDVALWRRNADGSADTTFAGSGKVVLDLGGGDAGNDVALAGDGTIVVAGTRGNGDLAIARYTAGGSLDNSFGAGGVTIIDFGGLDQAASVIVQSDGKIIESGYSGGTFVRDFVLVRVNQDGTLDASFGVGGKLVIPTSSTYLFKNDLALLSDGSILIAGNGWGGQDQDFVVARVTPNGALDNTFGVGGIATIRVGGSNDFATGLVVLDDGRIILAGLAYDGSHDNQALVALNADGTLETTFGSGGAVIVNYPEPRSTDQARDVKLSSDHLSVLASGYTYNDETAQFTEVRVGLDGKLDPTFGAQSSLDATAAYDGGAPVVLDSDVHVFDAELAAQGNYAGASLTLMRHGGASASDVYAGTGALGPLNPGGPIVYGDVAVGTVEVNSGGRLVLRFNSDATQERVDGMLSSIGYKNAGNTSPVTVQIDWSLSDGNSGVQGSGGAMTGTGSTTVSVLHTQQAYVWSQLANNQTIGGFHAEFDVLRFDGGISAANIAVTPTSLGTAFTVAGKTVTVTLDPLAITRGNVHIDDGSLLLVGNDAIDTLGDNDANNLAGGPANDNLMGAGGNDVLIGGGGHDVLKGGAGKNYLIGQTGDDTLDARGGAGSQLQGGAGNDVYHTDNAADTLIEFANEGTDAVITTLPKYVLRENIENLSFSGSGNFSGGGNALNNYIEGRAGDDVLSGEGGNDTLVGSGGRNYLVGGAGNDTLDGRGGSGSTLQGGIGDDRYLVDNLRDTLVEFQSEGTDEVRTTLSSYFLRDYVENLTFTGTGNFYGKGTAINNEIHGGGGDDLLAGGAGNDTLVGFGGRNYLVGGADNDVLDGRNGAGNQLQGGTGDDVYLVDDVRDSLIEFANEGSDEVRTTLGAYTLRDNLENLTYTGIGNFTGTGNSAANVIKGGAGNDLLNGLGGGDTLLGLGGDDVFVFDPNDVHVDGGAGSDTLRFVSLGEVLDLTTAAGATLFDMEIVDLTGTGANSVTLSADSVKVLSSTDVLRVDGNTGDSVVAAAPLGWTHGPDRAIGANTYHSYTQAGATLLVDSDVLSNL